MQTSPGIINKETPVREYRVERLTREKLADVAQLHAAVYRTLPDTDYFIRKYDTAYTGVAYVGFLAYSYDNIPVAYYGVIPCFIQDGNQVMLAAQSADTMTHPEYRFKGMFVELSNMTFDLCRQLGIRLLFGFPNQNSYHGAVNKLGWQMTGAMACFIIPVKSWPLEKLAGKSKFLNRWYRNYQSSVLRKYLLPLPGVANSVQADGYAGVCRSNDYFGYKKYGQAGVVGIGNVKIWMSVKRGILIGDMEGLNQSNAENVISQLKKIAGKMGVREIQFHCSEDTLLYEIFAANYKAIPSYPMLFQDFGSVVPPGKIKFTFADLDIF
jgi:hypothetical protein